MGRVRTARSPSPTPSAARPARPPAPRSGCGARLPGCGPARQTPAPGGAASTRAARRRLRRSSHAGDEAVDALVVGPERVLAQHGTLRLVVQLEVHPVDGEVAPALL